MPKRVLTDYRNDFSGGLHISENVDTLGPTDLVQALNVRLEGPRRSAVGRRGSRRLHAAAIGGGAGVDGVFQWDAPGGKELVAVANGNFYHKTSEYGAFTEVAASFGTGFPIHFYTFRDKDAAAALRLYMHSGATGIVYRWDGTSLTQVNGTDNFPTSKFGCPYHTRGFAVPTSNAKFVQWSKVGYGSDYNTGGKTDGGTAMVDTLTGDTIVAMAPIGSSLAISTAGSIALFHGYSSDDIQIAQDTEGLSSELGLISSRAHALIEKAWVIITKRGAYIVSEDGFQAAGPSVDKRFATIGVAGGMAANAETRMQGVHHLGRQEVWFSHYAFGDSEPYSRVLVWNYKLNAWYEFGFNKPIYSLAAYNNLTTGEHSIVAGGSDGFVRELDYGTLDDVLSDASGGSNIAATVEFAPMHFDTGPDMMKSLFRTQVQLTTVASSAFVVNWQFDSQNAQSSNVVAPAAADYNTPQNFRVDTGGHGGRLRMWLTHAAITSAEAIHGVRAFAYDMQRPNV